MTNTFILICANPKTCFHLIVTIIFTMKIPPSNGKDVTTRKTNRKVHYYLWLLLELSSGKFHNVISPWCPTVSSCWALVGVTHFNVLTISKVFNWTNII